MAYSKTARDPFEVKLSKEEAEDVVDFLCREIDYAEMARQTIVGDNNMLDRCHEMYEGGDPNLTKNTPWPGASNLGSFIVTEKVDAMRARCVATIFTDPIWIVEGWGESAERAPLVEAFHQWKSEIEKLQQFVGRVIHNALIEGTGVLEISDRVILRKGVRKIRALVQRDAQTGTVGLDASGTPIPVRTKAGKFVEAQSGEPHIEMVINDVVRATAGPSYRVLSLKNFFVLPGHASEREDVWGYVKKFYRRLPELQCRERDGFYRNVKELGEMSERQQTPQELRAGQDVAHQHGVTAEKEIYEVLYLADLDHDGYEEWYVVTLSRLHRVLLRVQYQDYGTPHFILFTPFPRPNSIYGYSFAWDKLGSLYDEHSALRNMFADRSALATSAPFVQSNGSLWNPALKPFGPMQVITVRDPNEIKQLEVKDVPQSVPLAIQQVLSASERLSGMNDTTTGQLSQQDRTLGEVKLVTEQSWIRIDEAVHNLHEGFEDLFALRQIIWVNKLQDDPEQLPGDLLLMMTQRGVHMPPDKEITADMLSGTFRGKPRSSVEGADFSKMRADTVQMLTALNQMAQTMPAIAMHLNDPKVVRSIMSQIARLYRWPDRANLVGTFTGEMPPPPPGAQSGKGGGENPETTMMKTASAEKIATIEALMEEKLARIKAETAISVAEINKRFDVFQEERARIGVQEQQAADHSHEAQQGNLDRVHELMTALQDHTQSMAQADQAHSHTMEQGKQDATGKAILAGQGHQNSLQQGDQKLHADTALADQSHGHALQKGEQDHQAARVLQKEKPKPKPAAKKK